MKHGIKTMKNKFFLGKGVGGYWGISNFENVGKFYNEVDLSVPDKKTFKVSHRIVSSTSMVVTYRRLYNYNLEVEVSGNDTLVYDLRSPSKENATL